jgi:tetratricopeptide (TPR) repeat protein
LIFLKRGISYDKKNDYDRAITDFTRAIELDPVKGDFYHNRGFALKKKNLLHEAIIDFTECIHLEKNHFKAYYNRANCYEKIGELELARLDYFKANDIVKYLINLFILFNNK